MIFIVQSFISVTCGNAKLQPTPALAEMQLASNIPKLGERRLMVPVLYYLTPKNPVPIAQQAVSVMRSIPGPSWETFLFH